MKKIFFIVFGIFLSVTTSVFAQIKLDKYLEKLDVTPGETVNGFIIVENTSNQAVTVTASLQDIAPVPPFNGNREFKPVGSTPYSLGDWITFSPEVLTLAPSAKQKVAYTLKVPKEAKGGYYGTIFFEKTAATPTEGFAVVLRMGCTFSVVTSNATKAIKIEDVSLTKDGIKGKFLNSGDIVLNSTYSYYVMDKKGTISDRGSVTKEFIVPPGEKVPFNIKLAKKVTEGNYSLVFNFNLAAERGSLIGEIEFAKDNAGNLKIVKVK